MAAFVLFFGAWRPGTVGIEQIGLYPDEPVLDGVVRDPYGDEEWSGEEVERRAAVIRGFVGTRAERVTIETVESLGGPRKRWMEPEVEKRLAADAQLANARRLLEFFERAV